MIHVRVPATSANLGPGFDCLGLALCLYNTITLQDAPRFQITLTGRYTENIPTDETNLVWHTMAGFWESIYFPVPPVALTMENNIPPARGLGSSSAAIVGGLVAANAYAGFPLSKLELLQLANELEGHPDNAAPALFGGVTLSVPSSDDVLLRILSSSPKLRATVVVPDLLLKTETARNLLKPEVPRGEAVYNIAHTALVTEAFLTENYTLLHEGMQDKLHQNQRSVLIPGMQETLNAALQAGAFGSALSGSGPTLIALTPFGAEYAVGQAMLQTLARYGLNAEAHYLGIDSEGVKAESFTRPAS